MQNISQQTIEPEEAGAFPDGGTCFFVYLVISLYLPGAA